MSLYYISKCELKMSYFPACVGCGYCCIKCQCCVSTLLYGLRHPCPALEWNGERYICKHAEEYKESLWIGEGCPSSLNSWRLDVKRREIEGELV